jgi:hypothetical protein
MDPYSQNSSGQSGGGITVCPPPYVKTVPGILKIVELVSRIKRMKTAGFKNKLLRQCWKFINMRRGLMSTKSKSGASVLNLHLFAVC